MRRVVQGDTQLDLDLPALDQDLLDNETQKLLPLLEIQLIDRSDDLLGKSRDTLSQAVLLTQFFAFTDERFSLGLECTSSSIQLLSPRQ